MCGPVLTSLLRARVLPSTSLPFTPPLSPLGWQEALRAASEPAGLVPVHTPQSDGRFMALEAPASESTVGHGAAASFPLRVSEVLTATGVRGAEGQHRIPGVTVQTPRQRPTAAVGEVLPVVTLGDVGRVLRPTRLRARAISGSAAAGPIQPCGQPRGRSSAAVVAGKTEATAGFS